MHTQQTQPILINVLSVTRRHKIAKINGDRRMVRYVDALTERNWTYFIHFMEENVIKIT